MADKKTYAVYIRTRRNGRSVLVREQYNIVDFGDGVTYIEGIASPELRLAAGCCTADQTTEEYFDDIKIYDTPPPFVTRMGTEAIRRS